MNGPKGVDLSHFNANPDFHTLRAAGIEFVYTKATQGRAYVDPTFEDHRQRALSVGLRAGAYHFFDPTIAGAVQAQHFLSVLGSLRSGEIPPALDLEATPGWDSLSLTGRQVSVKNWLLGVEKALGVRPMIYTSMGWFKETFGFADFSSYPLWLAHYAAEPGDTGPWKAWTAWQYGEFGRVAGAGNGDVDTDVWNGSLPAMAVAA